MLHPWKKRNNIYIYIPALPCRLRFWKSTWVQVSKSSRPDHLRHHAHQHNLLVWGGVHEVWRVMHYEYMQIYTLLTSSPFCELTSLIRLFLSTHGRNELCSMFILGTYSCLYPGFLVLWIMCWVKPHRMGILKTWRIAELHCIFWECSPTHVPSSPQKHDMQTLS
jgi:hypothetical protein